MKTILSGTVVLIILLFASTHVSAEEVCSRQSEEKPCGDGGTVGGGGGIGGSPGGSPGGSAGTTPPNPVLLENIAVVSTFIRSNPTWIASPDGIAYLISTMQPILNPPPPTPDKPKKPSIGGSLCRAAFAGGAAGFCTAYVAMCGAGTFFTFGVITVPCLTVAGALCVGITGTNVLIGEQVCQP